MTRPRRNEKKHGNLRLSARAHVFELQSTHLSKLSPVQVMSSIKFKDKDIIDLSFSPDPAVNDKEQHQNEHEKVAAIDL